MWKMSVVGFARCFDSFFHFLSMISILWKRLILNSRLLSLPRLKIFKGKNRPPLTVAVSKCQPWSGHSHRLQTDIPKRGDNARVGRRLALALLWRCRRLRLQPGIISKIRTARSWIGVQHGISRATDKQHKAMCRVCGSAGHWHGLSPELSHHLDASGGDKVVWGNTPGALPHAPVATASYINSLTAPLFWWHWFLEHE